MVSSSTGAEVTYQRVWFAEDMKQMGVVFYGYFFEPTGYGEASRAYVRAFFNAGINLSVVNLAPRMLVRDPFVESLLNRPLTSAFHLYHGDPSLMTSLIGARPDTIVMTAWETNRIPNKWVDVLNQVSEVWVPSRHNAVVFQKDLTIPVFRLPHPYVPVSSAVDTSEIDKKLGINNDDFMFYNVFAWQDRKNPLGLIEAFLEAFPDAPNVFLVLKTIFGLTEEQSAYSEIADFMGRLRRKNGRNSPVRTVTELAHSAAGTLLSCITGRPSIRHKRVKIVAGLWPEELLKALTKRGNCYISLHRGEGWCYPLFNAACSGIPVIATDFSGPADYLKSEHNLVRCSLTPVARKFANFTTNMLWAEPNIPHAASLMRYVYEHHSEVTEIAHASSRRLRVDYSLDVIGQMAARRLRTLGEHLEN